MKKNKLLLTASIILYVFAVLLMAFTVWAFIHCIGVVSQAISAGQLAASGSEYEIVNFYLANCGQYFVYALLLAAAGLILHSKQPKSEVKEISANTAKVNTNDNELDKWFDKIDETNGEQTEEI